MIRTVFPGQRFAALALLLVAWCVAALVACEPRPAEAQTRDDSLRTELVRSRGFIRAAETQLTKTLALLTSAPAEAGPPVVRDWRSGEWQLLAGGYQGVINLDAQTVTAQGITAPAVVEISGDTLRMRLAVPGWEDAALLELVHAEGRLIGTVTAEGETRPAAGQRIDLQVVRTMEVGDGCTAAAYTDGSWGVGPYTGPCHQALVEHVGAMRFVAREYTP